MLLLLVLCLSALMKARHLLTTSLAPRFLDSTDSTYPFIGAYVLTEGNSNGTILVIDKRSELFCRKKNKLKLTL